MLSSESRANEDVLDRVYLKYAESDPFMPITHFIDHSTMGAEALVELGLGDKVEQWISHHGTRPYRAPMSGIPIAAEWPRALGRQECHGDWIKHFEAELAARPFREVLGTWAPRFAHEVGAFLFHGVIRTAHATRALEHKETAARRGELARGLALWAIGVKSAPPSSADAANSATPPRSDFLDFARCGAASFLDDPNVPKLHLVTGPMAYLLIEPYLDAKGHALAKASFAATHDKAVARFPELRQKVLAAPNLSRDRANLEALVEQRDAHPSKLTEAALRAHAESQDEIFLKAAGQALKLHSLRALLGVAKALLSRRVA